MMNHLGLCSEGLNGNDHGGGGDGYLCMECTAIQVLLFVMGVFRLGRLLNYASHSVLSGFTTVSGSGSSSSSSSSSSSTASRLLTPLVLLLLLLLLLLTQPHSPWPLLS